MRGGPELTYVEQPFLDQLASMGWKVVVMHRDHVLSAGDYARAFRPRLDRGSSWNKFQWFRHVTKRARQGVINGRAFISAFSARSLRPQVRT